MPNYVTSQKSLMALIVVKADEAEQATWALEKLGAGLGEGVTVIQVDEEIEAFLFEYQAHLAGECSDETWSPESHAAYHRAFRALLEIPA